MQYPQPTLSAKWPRLLGMVLLSVLFHGGIVVPWLATRLQSPQKTNTPIPDVLVDCIEQDANQEASSSTSGFVCKNETVHAQSSPETVPLQPDLQESVVLPPPDAEKPIELKVTTHKKMVDQNQYPDQADNPDADLLAEKNHRAPKENKGLSGQKTTKTGPLDVPRVQPGSPTGAPSAQDWVVRPASPSSVDPGASGQGAAPGAGKQLVDGNPYKPLTPLDYMNKVGSKKFREEVEAGPPGGAGWTMTQEEHLQAWSEESREILSPAYMSYGLRMSEAGPLNTRAHPAATYITRLHGSIHRRWAEGLWARVQQLPGLSEETRIIFLLVLNENGALCRAQIYEQKNTTSAYDALALSALIWSTPFPSTPAVLRSPNGKTYVTWGFYKDGRQCHTDDATVHYPVRGKQPETCRSQLVRLTTGSSGKKSP